MPRYDAPRVGENAAPKGAGGKEQRMFEISVCGWFAAAHQLPVSGGSFEPLHGHNWRVQVTFRGERLDERGMLLDFLALDAVLAELHDRNLNELPAFAGRPPSAEHVAALLAERLADTGGPAAHLACVEVEEAPGCMARYRPE
jgi:6-pyruvoyltetrahydropterin/6-carboxytetrahydropterin synthase